MLSSCPIIPLKWFMIIGKKVQLYLDTWCQECHPFYLVGILFHPFPTVSWECSFLREICIKAEQRFRWHSNCTDVCLSQKVSDVMGLHLECFSVINGLEVEEEARGESTRSTMPFLLFYFFYIKMILSFV